MPSVTPLLVSHASARVRPVGALWRLRGYLKPFRTQMIVMFAAALGAVAAEIAIPLLTKSVVDGAIARGDKQMLIPLALAAVALGAAVGLLNMIRRWIQSGAVADIEKSIRDDIYAHLQRLHASFHDSWQSGQLLSRATTDLSSIRRFAGFGLIFLVTNVMTFLAVVALLINLNWWLGLVTAVVFAPVLPVCFRFEKRYRVLSRQVQDQQGDLATLIEESATGIRVLKALGRGRQAAARHDAQAAEVCRTQIAKAGLLGSFWALLDLIPNAVIGLILVLGAIAVSTHSLTLGGLVAFITLALQLVWPVEAMGYIIASGQEAATAAQRVLEIFDTEPEITSKDQGHDPERAPVPVQRSASRRGQRRPRGHLVFDHVTFSYPGAAEPVLRDIVLDLAPGQTVVLTGATGSGKSTLLQLVPRLADATSGSVRLDGTDVRDLPLERLRAAVGCAFEDATLFSASVRENVMFGAPDADEDAVEAALTAAQARFAYDLPWGLDTRIGEQGMALSGGQRQRIALARAILARPDVLILDDPLSALDVHTEERVTRALHEILAGSTALVVAHRPSTVALADTVALLSGGVIAASGSHRHTAGVEPGVRSAHGHGGSGGQRLSTDAWRGVAAEKAEEVSAGLAALLRERSRRLLGDLLRPYRRAVIATISLIVVESLAALAGPWLVGIAIDTGLPPLLHARDAAPLLGIAAAFAVAVGVQAVTTRLFVTKTGQVGQKVVLELRRRLFAHFLSLEVAFHEDYTSGRVISRQTSDIESISDLFEEGLDSLIAAILTLLLVGTGMLLLDWKLGLVVLAGFIPLTWLTAWFRRESASAYRRTREAIALVIVHFVETFGGIRAVQAFRREDRNSDIFSGLGQDYAQASTHASRLIAIYGPSISLVGNIITGVVLGYGGLLAIEGNLKVGILATFLLYLQRFFDPLQDVSQFYNIFQSAASGLEKISGVLEQDATVPEPSAPEPLPTRAVAPTAARLPWPPARAPSS